MSDNFHKICYTTRSPGYKYRTLSTNTGDRKRRDSKEDTVFDIKFKELKREICYRVTQEVDDSQSARQSILEKMEKIDIKINAMLDMQNNIIELRKDLRRAENTLVDAMEKVEKIEGLIGDSEGCSLKSPKNSFRTPRPITEKEEPTNLMTFPPIEKLNI